MALVKFVSDTAANYAALPVKDENTLYFISDERQLYKGSTPYGGANWKVVSELPTIGETNTNYIVTGPNDTKALYFYNGSFVKLFDTTTTINKNSTNDTVPTTKSVYDFVLAEVAKVDASGIGASITELENRIQDVEDGKADAATTLAGYGITDAYTKTETDTAIAAAIADVDHLKRAIVDALPALADADENTIYMVALENGSGNQNYEEFILLNGAFEKLGDTSVSLTGYATETYVDNAFDSTKIAYEAADQTILQTAADYADGLADNYATAAQGALADSAIQEIEEGEANGTISVDGTDVSVHGLGTAAYTDATAYDASGSAATALTNAKAYVDAAITSALSWNEISL